MEKAVPGLERVSIEDVLKGHLSMRGALGADMPLARLVLAMGTVRRGIPYAGRRMAAKQCFSNALRHAERHGMLYAEGYGLSGGLAASGLVFPVEHAWCVDGHGNAVDPTWGCPEGSVYLGIEFSPRDALRRVAAKGTYGMFFDGVAGREDHGFMESVMPGLRPGMVDEAFRPDRSPVPGP